MQTLQQARDGSEGVKLSTPRECSAMLAIEPLERRCLFSGGEVSGVN